MSKQIRLLPCPFCGSEHITLWEDIHDGSCVVECRDCNVSTRRYYNVEQRERAVKAWNTRANTSERSEV